MVTENTELLDDSNDESEPTYTRLTKKIAGCMLVLFGSVSYVTSVCCVQALGDSVPGFQLNFWRFFGQFIIGLPILAKLKCGVSIPRAAIPYMCLVCVAYNVENFAGYAAPRYLPTATIGCVNVAVSLLLTFVVSLIIFKQFRLHVAAATFVCLVGSVFVTQPEFIFREDNAAAYSRHPLCGLRHDWSPGSDLPSNNFTTSTIANVTSDPNPSNGSVKYFNDNIALGYTYNILSAAMYVLITFVVNLKLAEVDPFVTASWVSASGIVLSLAGMGIFEKPTFPEGSVCQSLLMAHALTAGLYSTVKIVAMGLISPALIALMETIEPVELAFAQYAVMRNIIPGHRNIMELAGAVAVLVGNIIGPVYDLYTDALTQKRHHDM